MSGSGAFRVYVALHMVDNASKHLIHFSNLAKGAGQNVGHINRQLKLMGGLGAMMVGGAVVAGFVHLGKESVDAAKKVEKLKFELQGLGLTTKQITGVTTEVSRLTKMFPALSTATAYHNFKDSYAVFGNYREAMRMQAYMAKFNLGLQGLYGERAEEMGWDAQRAAELQMGGQFNAYKMMKYLDSYMRVAYMTGGKVDMHAIHGMMKNMPYTRTSQSPQAIANMAVMMQEMGGPRAGTGFTAMDRFAVAHLAAHGVSKEKREKWFQLGLLENVKRNAKGNIADFTLKNQDLYLKDKVEWLYTVLGPAFAKKGVDITNPSSIPAMAGLWSSQNAAGINISTALQRYAVKRHQGMYGEAFGTEEAAAKFSKSDLGKFAALNVAMENLKVALGQNLIPMFAQWAAALTPVVQELKSFVEQHPKLTRFLFIFGLLGAAALVVGGAIVTATALIAALPGVTVAGVLGVAAAVTAGLATIAALITNSGIVAAWFKVVSAVTAMVYNLASGLPGLGHLKYEAMNVQQRADTSKPVKGLRGHGSSASWSPTGLHKSQAGQGVQISNNFVIEGYAKDKKELAQEIAAAISSSAKKLVTPTSGHNWYEAPGAMTAFG